ncbi:MAG: RHS repeat-associated core domain-containing protein [Planctomycetaceae bacterium]
MEYTYDLFDRRIARQVDADGTAGFETTQRFVYDGEDLILAFSGSTNTLTNRYLYGPATDEILADEKITTGTASTAGTVTWSLGDNLGTIRDLVQDNATTGTTTVVNHVRYDTFGQIVSQTNSQFQLWFAYTGREWDPAAGLYFYRARWYDPRAGRFLSEDPIGFAACDVNLNRYVGNGATLWVDPSGMAMSDPYVPAAGGMTNQDYADYMQSQKGIANLLVDKDAVADLLGRNSLYSEEFIDEYIDELYGPGRMNHLREGLKDGLHEMMYQVALEVGTHYGAAGAGWFGARILGWAAKKFSSMWKAWRGSRVVTKALAEGVEASAEQSARGLKGTPGPTPQSPGSKGSRFALNTPKATVDQMQAAVRRLDHLDSVKGTTLSADEIAGLTENARLVAKKYWELKGTARTTQSVMNQLNRPRWRFLDYAPEAKDILDEVIKDLRGEQ